MALHSLLPRIMNSFSESHLLRGLLRVEMALIDFGVRIDFPRTPFDRRSEGIALCSERFST